ncbi:uncharacterized protein LOC6572623 isoform X1 [Drosophila mojavensis]|nr:uncharacterized protein LOC6572623 isoform X1 [Drosophila mojavensis]
MESEDRSKEVTESKSKDTLDDKSKEGTDEKRRETTDEKNRAVSEVNSMLLLGTASSRAKSMSKLYTGNSPLALRRTTTMQVPNVDVNKSLHRFKRRNPNDPPRPKVEMDMILYDEKYKPNDTPDLYDREPSFRKFKIPYPMICAKRYQDSIRAYEAQLEHEIKQNIDFQRTASDACYFMRCVAYTTFWPPLHNMTEVKRTSKSFFQLTEKEKWRLNNIMNTDII